MHDFTDRLKEHLLPNTACVICPVGGTPYITHNADMRFRSASVIKLFLLSYALEHDDVNATVRFCDKTHASALGELNLESAALDTLLLMMIASSDNGATNVLIDRYDFDTLNAYIRSLKTKETSINRKMLDYEAIDNGKDNYTCASDVLLIYKYLASLGTSWERYAGCAKCLDRLMKYIYCGCRFFGKAGDMQGAFHDTGILDVSGRRVCAVFLSDSYKDAENGCGMTGLAALEALNQGEM